MEGCHPSDSNGMEFSYNLFLIVPSNHSFPYNSFEPESSGCGQFCEAMVFWTLGLQDRDYINTRSSWYYHLYHPFFFLPSHSFFFTLCSLSSSPSVFLVLFSPLSSSLPWYVQLCIRISKGQASMVMLAILKYYRPECAVMLENRHQRAHLILTVMSCLESFCNARLEVLMAVTVMVTIFWDVATRGLVDRYQHFGGTHYFHFQGKRENFYCSVLKMKMSGSSQTSAVIYTWLHIITPQKTVIIS